MKKLLLIFILFTACSKENIEPVVIDITGTYKEVLDLNQVITINESYLVYYDQQVPYTFMNDNLRAIIDVEGIQMQDCAYTKIKVDMQYIENRFEGTWTYYLTSCGGPDVYLEPIIVKFVKK